MTKSSQLHLGDHKSSEFIKQSHLSSDVLLEHNSADFTASCCSLLSLIWNVHLLLNMVSVKLLFLLLQKT